MHELSVCEHLLNLLDQEAARHGVNKITRVRLEISRLSCLEPNALRFAFDTMAVGTIAETAELQIDRPLIGATCKGCGAAVKLDSRLDACPSCDSTRLEIRGGEEMRLLEMEAA